MSSSIPLSPTPPHHHIPSRLSPAEEQEARQREQLKEPMAGVAAVLAAVPTIHLDDVIRDIVRCDDELCPDIFHSTSLAQNMIFEHQFPRIASAFYRCLKTSVDQNDCVEMYEGGMNRVLPILAGKLNHERIKVKSDPLLNHDATSYNHSFWYQGMGDIWRRTANNSRLVTPADCQSVILESERCFKDPAKIKDGTCFKLYGEAFACESGAHCSYLQIPLLSCLSRKSIVESGNYETLKECLQDTPNFELCRTQSIPLTAEVSRSLGIPHQEAAT